MLCSYFGTLQTIGEFHKFIDDKPQRPETILDHGGIPPTQPKNQPPQAENLCSADHPHPRQNLAIFAILALFVLYTPHPPRCRKN